MSGSPGAVCVERRGTPEDFTVQPPEIIGAILDLAPGTGESAVGGGTIWA